MQSGQKVTYEQAKPLICFSLKNLDLCQPPLVWPTPFMSEAFRSTKDRGVEDTDPLCQLT